MTSAYRLIVTDTSPLFTLVLADALDALLRADPVAEALLLFEDTDLERRRAIVDDRVGLIGTGDFLRELEGARLIQSSDRILDQAAARGRNVERRRSAGEDGTARDRLRLQLRQRDQCEPEP